MSYSILKDITILTVEEDESELCEIGSLLDIYFKKCYRAKDGNEGYKLFLENKIDIVLSDVWMPRLDGFSMLKKIRAVDKDVVAIIYTVLTNEATFLSAIDNDVSAFVVKPASANKLLDTLLKESNNIIRDKELRREQLLTQTILDKFPYKIMLTDLDHNVILANALVKNTPYWDDKNEIKCYEALYGVKEQCRAPQKICNQDKMIKTGLGDVQWHSIIENNKQVYLETETIPLKDEEGKVYSFLKISKDITKRKRREMRLQSMANHDMLTGLPNRILLHDRLEQAVLRSDRNGCEFALLFMDIDDFKIINDNYGHHCGDILLKKMSKRVVGSIRKMDTLARFGGDEFVLILESISSKEQCRAIIKEIFAKIRAPFKLTDEFTVDVSCSVGVDMYSPKKRKRSKEAIISNADKAMYEAKKDGKNRFSFFEGT